MYYVNPPRTLDITAVYQVSNNNNVLLSTEQGWNVVMTPTFEHTLSLSSSIQQYLVGFSVALATGYEHDFWIEFWRRPLEKMSLSFLLGYFFKWALYWYIYPCYDACSMIADTDREHSSGVSTRIIGCCIFLFTPVCPLATDAWRSGGHISYNAWY